MLQRLRRVLALIGWTAAASALGEDEAPDPHLGGLEESVRRMDGVLRSTQEVGPAQLATREAKYLVLGGYLQSAHQVIFKKLSRCDSVCRCFDLHPVRRRINCISDTSDWFWNQSQRGTRKSLGTTGILLTKCVDTYRIATSGILSSWHRLSDIL